MVKMKTIHAPSHHAHGIDGSDQSSWAATSRASSSSAVESFPSAFWLATSGQGSYTTLLPQGLELPLVATSLS